MAKEKRLIDANKLMVCTINTGTVMFPRMEAFVRVEAIEAAPIVDAVEVVHGKWIKKKLVMCEAYYLCSVCGKLHDQEFNFCNNCGAKMDGGNEDG